MVKKIKELKPLSNQEYKSNHIYDHLRLSRHPIKGQGLPDGIKETYSAGQKEEGCEAGLETVYRRCCAFENAKSISQALQTHHVPPEGTYFTTGMSHTTAHAKVYLSPKDTLVITV